MQFDLPDFPSDLDVFVEYQARFVKRVDGEAVKFDKWYHAYRRKYPLSNHGKAIISDHFSRELARLALLERGGDDSSSSSRRR